MTDTPACLAALENEIWRLDRERPMLAKRHWYMEQGMPATAHYLDAAKVLHDAAPDLIAKARRVDALEEALRDLLDLDQRSGWHSKQADAARAALGGQP